LDTSFPGGESANAKQEETSLVVKSGVQRQLQVVIERLFEQCFQQKRYRQVVGIAIEARNLEILRKAILRCSEDEKQGESSRRGEELMEYVLDICMGVLQERGFRNEV
jgi:26S proteasome regulatory subunit N2